MSRTKQLLANVGLSALAATSGIANAQPAARLRGVVYDSVARAPLANASVRVFRADSAWVGIDARTDASGTFDVTALRTGTWLVSFLHPRLDSLRLEPPVARVDVVEAGEINVTLAVPSSASLARALCGSRAEDSTAVVVGDVRDASGRRPVAGATVRASWPEWVFAKNEMERERVARVARSDSTGQFVLCHVPQGTTVTALAHAGRDSTGVIELAIPATEYMVADFVVDRMAALVTGDGAGASWRRGAGAVRGEVTTADGKPFVSAVARVLGSGTAVRTDSNGVFRIADAAAGTQTVEVRAVGYDPIRQLVQLTPGEPIVASFTLDKSRATLDTIRVVAGRKLPPDIQAIERRWRRGLGTILDGRTVRERTSTSLTSALWSVPGVRLGMRAGYGNTVYLRGNSGGDCIPPIYLDGFRFIANGLSLDEIVPPSDVAAMEVYTRPMQRPAEFTDLDDCGVLAVWTTRFLGNIPVMDPRKRKP
ncbi:carboxypeptidase regulatory-like domain-containing protein [Gemmatimonas sp.]|uniref:carboxypeptidase regulatory-like domain-containing protein n=1 Tax=Gemmatimonas sp. TaxID=1962908 RepID=UPI0027B9C16D|nr:carboxypeptidase regulatory-like domain-containing protein [Gemmatimonas sp.]